MEGFSGSDNKSTLRILWDLPSIKRWKNRLKRDLHYFGLPGPKVEDLIDWRECIHQSTGVERLRKGSFYEKDLLIHRQILKNVMLNDIQNFQLLRGLIENILIDGTDNDRNKPKKSSIDHPLKARFQYDLMNLDFLGGMGNKDKYGASRRVTALKKMFERQQGTDFLLLTTLNVRDKMEDVITDYLLGASREAANNSWREHEEILAWYTNLGEGMKDYKLKALIPLFIKREAETRGFDCYAYPPVTYTGTGSARMVHFVFELKYVAPILHAFSQQSESDLLNLPLLEVNDGRILVLDKQHPNFDLASCKNQFDLLPETLKIMLLETLKM